MTEKASWQSWRIMMVFSAIGIFAGALIGRNIFGHNDVTDFLANALGWGLMLFAVFYPYFERRFAHKPTK